MSASRIRRRRAVPEPALDPDAAARPNVIHTEQLFGTRQEVIIEHRNEKARLRITRADKLILGGLVKEF